MDYGYGAQRRGGLRHRWGSLPNTLTTKGTKGHEGLTAEIAEVFVESAEQSVHLEGRYGFAKIAKTASSTPLLHVPAADFDRGIRAAEVGFAVGSRDLALLTGQQRDVVVLP